jgi:hypothetical protein
LTARSTSSVPAEATVVMDSWVAGLVVTKISPEAASTCSPLMSGLPGFTGAAGRRGACRPGARGIEDLSPCTPEEGEATPAVRLQTDLSRSRQADVAAEQ